MHQPSPSLAPADRQETVVVIVGAGPAGLLLAHYLLRRGRYRVLLYERRPDPRQIPPQHNRSFPISLQARGRQALQAIPGLEEAIAQHGVFCYGTTVYRQQQCRDIPRQNAVLTIDRNVLVRVLLEQVMAMSGSDRCQIQFNCTCEQIDLPQRTVTVSQSLPDSDPHTLTVAYDWLVGADGARSQVRQQLAAQDQIWCEMAEVVDAYKSLSLSRIDPHTGEGLANNRIHTANIDNNCRIILAPQPGDRLLGAFIFNAAHNPFEQFSDPTDILDYFATHVPRFRPLLSASDAAELWQRPVARLVKVTCDRFHGRDGGGDRVLLLGDAAHAVSPSIGQGCNASLQDVAIFNRLLDQYQDDWAQVLPEFSTQRVPDAHALRDLSDYTFPRRPGLVLEFFLRLILSRLLHRWWPQWFQPFLFDLILDTDRPYAEVLRQGQGWVNKVRRSSPVV